MWSLNILYWCGEGVMWSGGIRGMVQDSNLQVPTKGKELNHGGTTTPWHPPQKNEMK